MNHNIEVCGDIVNDLLPYNVSASHTNQNVFVSVVPIQMIQKNSKIPYNQYVSSIPL